MFNQWTFLSAFLPFRQKPMKNGRVQSKFRHWVTICTRLYLRLLSQNQCSCHFSLWFPGALSQNPAKITRKAKKHTHRAHQGKRREKKMSSSWLPWLENIYSHTTQFITKRQSDDVLFPIALNSFSDHYAVYVCLCVSVAEVKAKVTGREMAINLLELKSNSEKNTNAIVCTLKHSHTFKFNLNECPEYIGAYKFAK